MAVPSSVSRLSSSRSETSRPYPVPAAERMRVAPRGRQPHDLCESCERESFNSTPASRDQRFSCYQDLSRLGNPRPQNGITVTTYMLRRARFPLRCLGALRVGAGFARRARAAEPRYERGDQRPGVLRLEKHRSADAPIAALRDMVWYARVPTPRPSCPGPMIRKPSPYSVNCPVIRWPNLPAKP